MDATLEDGRLGRLVNDDHKRPNCKMRKRNFRNQPYLCLFALRDIAEGVELTYDYGDPSVPWRKTTTVGSSHPSMDDISGNRGGQPVDIASGGLSVDISSGRVGQPVENTSGSELNTTSLSSGPHVDIASGSGSQPVDIASDKADA